MPANSAVAKVLASGFMLDVKAFDMISQLPTDGDREALVDRLLAQKSASPGFAKMITEDDVVALMPREQPQQNDQVLLSEPSELEVVSDPTLAISPAEDAQGFGKLFQDRYNRLYSVVKARLDTKSSGTVSAAKSVAPGKRIKVAGLLSDRSSRRGTVELRIDDPTGTLKVICQDPLAERSALEAPLDSMVVAEVSRGKS